MPKILIIDDNDSFRKMLADMLKRAGYEISEAVNGDMGIESYIKNPTDLVITDIFMPKKSGQEVIMELKQKYPHLKIIAISGGGDNGSLEFLKDTQNMGADNYLSKPFKMKELFETVNKVIHGTRTIDPVKFSV